MNSEKILETIKRELPDMLRADPGLREYVLELTRRKYADHDKTEDRFDRMLNELAHDREEQAQKWEESNRKWEESNRKWKENSRRWEENNRKWKEYIRKQDKKWEEYTSRQDKKWEEYIRKQDKKWEEYTSKQDKKWEENNRKWEQSRKEFDKVHEEIMAITKKHDRHIGALGARWGMQSERAFRNALAGILEKSFAVEVININEYDDGGEVFGRPDQVELDVIIKNGVLLICELKSSMSKADVYLFERKARFYEKRHERKSDRLIVVSPMIDKKALAVAEDLGIETYWDSTEVEL